MNSAAKGYRRTMFNKGDYTQPRLQTSKQTRSIESTFGTTKKDQLDEVKLINPKMKVPQRSRPKTVKAPIVDVIDMIRESLGKLPREPMLVKMETKAAKKLAKLKMSESVHDGVKR
jgi:hypothetical protein